MQKSSRNDIESSIESADDGHLYQASVLLANDECLWKDFPRRLTALPMFIGFVPRSILVQLAVLPTQ
jgi:hypothetical protein